MVIAQDDLEQQVEGYEIALISGIGITLLLIDVAFRLEQLGYQERLLQVQDPKDCQHGKQCLFGDGMNKTSTHSYGLFEYLVYQREGSLIIPNFLMIDDLG